ncbi:MAG: glycosyltransferase [Actinomycetota bacterium]|nr:glycosyltransferase [Acidimicrobiia bacterium]MDQ3146336.1 glycosyltransferase [Actinomycetota bacterium]
MATVIDVVMPARNEEATVAVNVAAARGCQYVREVIVIDDGSSDATAERALVAGAKVIRREGGEGTGGSEGSKALAMAEGVAATDAEAILFVDADCTGLTASHLDRICMPFLEGRAVMSIGAFDYGPFWNPQVLRWPPLSGERVLPRWLFEAVPPPCRQGYTIEVRLNEVVAEGRLPTSVQTMAGVSHRTKRDKLGRRVGLRHTVAMYRELLGLLLPGGVRWRTYWFYLRGLTVER